MSRYFAVLDPGSSGLAAASARWDKNGDYALDGLCRVDSGGFRKGMVADVIVATDSIAKVLNKLKEKTGKKIQDVYAAVSSTSVKMTPSSGILLLSRYGREVSERDVEKCVQIGSTIKVPLDREPLHRIVSGFTIDGEKGIKNPLGLEGVKLGVDVNVLTINSSVLRNMSRCISQAGFVPAGFVFSGLASANRVLTGSDRERGVALLDICEDMTEVMIFYRGILNGCRVFPGGTERILAGDDCIDTAEWGELSSNITSLPEWKNVCKVVVIGKGALMDNLIESLEKLFMLPVKAGTCITRSVENLPPERAGYIGSLGILDYLQQERWRQRRNSSMIKRTAGRILGFLDRYF